MNYNPYDHYEANYETPGLVDAMDAMEDEEAASRLSPPSCYSPNPGDIRAPKKTILCDSFSYEVVAQKRVRVQEGGAFLVYNPQTHCYQPVDSLLSSILEVLGDDGANFSTKDLEEIERRIRINAKFFMSADRFDSVPNLINTQSGVLDWQTQIVTPHSVDDAFTYCVNASFLGDDLDDLHTPTFDAFSQTSLEGDAKKRQLLLEILGYCLSDCTGAKRAFFLKGAPDSGKSILLEFISRLLQPTVIAHVPLHKLHDRFSAASYYNKKLNTDGEIKGKPLNDSSFFKAITGGDQIQIEFKGKPSFFSRVRCKMIFAGNALPGTNETDATSAFANRLTVLLFNRSIPTAEQDKGLLDKLMEERHGIFTKAMYALRDLHGRNYRFELPKDSITFLKDFSGRHNSLTGFLAECCEVDSNSFITNVDLLKTYEGYCKRNGFDAYSRNKLYEMIAAVPGVRNGQRRVGGNPVHVKVGLRFSPQKTDTTDTAKVDDQQINMRDKEGE